MAQRTVIIDPIGEVVLAKRRGAANIRLSVTAKGVVRVGLPYWVPYAAGTAFAKSRLPWIAEQLNKHPKSTFASGSIVGKSHRLYFRQGSGIKNISLRVTPTEILVIHPANTTIDKLQEKARVGAEQALKKQAQTLLPQRLAYLATKHGYTFTDVRVRKLSSRWGSCSESKVITLNYFLMQLPWELIDYVLVHELLHTKHMNHGNNFWKAFEHITPNAKKLKKEVNKHKPQVVSQQPALPLA